MVGAVSLARRAPLRAAPAQRKRAPARRAPRPLEAGRARCCGGYLPGEGPEHLTCTCGSDWAAPGARLGAEAWAQIEHLLRVRSGNRCEIVSAACLAGARGALDALPRSAISIHHRLPRGSGGTRRPETNSLARLMLACGTGTTGCHGWAESNRTAAEVRGILLRHVHGRGEETDAAAAVLLLPGGRRVLLDPRAPAYLPAPGPPYDLAPWPT